jgi:ketosteroid isomerase-like protein
MSLRFVCSARLRDTQSYPMTPTATRRMLGFREQRLISSGLDRDITAWEILVEFSAAWRKIFIGMTIVALIGLAPPLAQTARAQSQTPAASKAADRGIRDATVLFYAAFNSALHGDLAPMGAVWSHRPDVSNLSAAGGHATGWNEVRAGFLNMARLYPDSNITQRDMTVVTGTDMGYSVCTETGRLRSSEGPMVTFNQRATNIFRLEGGTWKLIHHHADSNISNSDAATR